MRLKRHVNFMHTVLQKRMIYDVFDWLLYLEAPIRTNGMCQQNIKFDWLGAISVQWKSVNQVRYLWQSWLHEYGHVCFIWSIL